MSKYSHFAKELDLLARARFTDYIVAKVDLDEATARRKDSVVRNAADAKQIANAARAEATYIEAKAAFEKAKAALQSSYSDAEAIQKRMIKMIREASMAKPEDMDSAMLELLKSGMLRPEEYAEGLRRYEGNPTMVRLIGHYADVARTSFADDAASLTTLRGVIHNARTAANEDEHVAAFDMLLDAYKRTVNNPLMIPHWEKITGECIQNF